MVKAIQKRFNWQSRKTRIVAALCVAGMGLAAGFFGSAVRKAFAGEPKQTYCDYTYTGEPLKCNVIEHTTILGVPVYYVCVPCPPAAAPCSEGSAAGWVNGQCGSQTNAGDFANYSTDCGTCFAPTSVE